MRWNWTGEHTWRHRRYGTGVGAPWVVACTLSVAILGLAAQDAAGHERDPGAAMPRSAAGHLTPPPSQLWRDGSGHWVHQDSRLFRIYLETRSPRLRYWLARAAGAWSRRTIVTIRLTQDPAEANVVVRDARHGAEHAGWVGRPCASCSPAIVLFDVEQLARWAQVSRAPLDTVFAAATCHELGHVLGLWHGGGDCMSFGYHRTRTFGIGQSSVRLINGVYSSRVVTEPGRRDGTP
jgi:hypothetical protein